MYNSHYIFVNIKDKDGADVAGATVAIKDSSGSQVWSGTTDENGLTYHILLSGKEIDLNGASSTTTYTIEAEKDDLSGSMDLTPSQNQTISLALEGESDDGEDGMDLTFIILILVIVIVVVIALVAVMKKRSK